MAKATVYCLWGFCVGPCFGLNNIYSEKVHNIHKYNVKIVGSDSKPVAYLDHLLDILYNLYFI